MRTASQLADNDAAHDARVSNQRHRIIGWRDRDGAILHAHRFDARVPRLTHQHAATEVGADIAVAEMNVMDISIFGKGEKARVRLGLPEIAMVIQTYDVVALAVETALERVVLVAEGKRPVLFHDFFELAAILVELAEIDIGRKFDISRVGRFLRVTESRSTAHRRWQPLSFGPSGL